MRPELNMQSPGDVFRLHDAAADHFAATLALDRGKPRRAVVILERALGRGLTPGMAAEMRALRSAAFRLMDACGSAGNGENDGDGGAR